LEITLPFVFIIITLKKEISRENDNNFYLNFLKYSYKKIFIKMGPVVPIFLLIAQSIAQPQKSANYELSLGFS